MEITVKRLVNGWLINDNYFAGTSKEVYVPADPSSHFLFRARINVVFESEDGRITAAKDR